MMAKIKKFIGEVRQFFADAAYFRKLWKQSKRQDERSWYLNLYNRKRKPKNKK